MKRISLPPTGADPRLDLVVAWLEGLSDAPWSTIAAASEDASFRRYFRVTRDDGGSAIVMDAPPELENTAHFVTVLRLLEGGGINVPRLLAEDGARGFLLLGDLGPKTFLSALSTLGASDAPSRNALVHDAIDALVRLQLIDPNKAQPALGQYHARLLRREIDLFPDWYLKTHLQLELSNDEKEGLERVYATLIASALAQPTVLVHRDYRPRNLMVMNDRANNPGVLDFQDAVVGPISYDIASLMRDAFISWEEPQVIDWTIRYWEKAKKAGLPVRADFSEFYREFEWMGLQRHLKVMGIFARINYRDGKPKYLADAPRFVSYVRGVAGRYEAFAPLLRLFDRIEQHAPQVGYTF
ncbi:MAG: aminoglycoside phosphotransferase [Burkholderiales bacterium]|nr:MAG: aminoglycoside phosphotransferase [Burkholderiales bacterium]